MNFLRSLTCTLASSSRFFFTKMTWWTDLSAGALPFAWLDVVAGDHVDLEAVHRRLRVWVLGILLPGLVALERLSPHGQPDLLEPAFVALRAIFTKTSMSTSPGSHVSLA